MAVRVLTALFQPTFIFSASSRVPFLGGVNGQVMKGTTRSPKPTLIHHTQDICQDTPLPSKELQPLAGVRFRGPSTSSIGYFFWISQQDGCRKLDFSPSRYTHQCNPNCSSNPLALFMNCGIETSAHEITFPERFRRNSWVREEEQE